MLLKTKCLFYLLFIIFLLSETVQAQKNSVEFIYDKGTGNRIKRSIIILHNQKQNTDTTIFTNKYKTIFQDIEITIFPNPNGGKFKVQLKNMDDKQEAIISLSNLLGEIIYNKRCHNETIEIDIHTNSNGAYILYINIGGKLKSWKIIKT